MAPYQMKRIFFLNRIGAGLAPVDSQRRIPAHGAAFFVGLGDENIVSPCPRRFLNEAKTHGERGPTPSGQTLASPSLFRAAPELLRGESRAFCEGLELGPRDVLVHLVTRARRPEPAIVRRNHPLPTEHAREAHDPLGHQLGVLDQLNSM